jgi:hypothetical protein
MKKELIISLYNKDISWISKLNSDIKITIYRKGNLITHPNEIYLQNNIGRDVHTFFYHIYNNYDNLSDLTFFSQDYPFDHISNYIEIINSDIETISQKATLHFNGYWGFHWNDIGTMWHMPTSIQFTKGNVLTCESSGSPHDQGLNVNSVWVDLFKSTSPTYYEFIPGGHFGVSKETVHIRSKKFYGRIVELLETQEKMPWNIERLEPYIFNQNYNSNYE